MQQRLFSNEAADFRPPPSNASLRNRWSYYFAVVITSLIGSCGEILLLVLPTYLTVIGHTAKLTTSQLGFVASTASAGLFVGSFLSAFSLSRFSSRVIVRTMLAVAATMQISLIFADSFIFVIAATAVAAVSGGLAYGAIYAVLSLQRDPARAFAIFVALQLIFNFGLLFVAPYLMEWAGGPLGLFSLLAICGFSFALLSGVVPNILTTRDAAVDHSRRREYPLQMALGGFFLFAVGMGATWAYIELVGQGRGFATREVEHFLSYGQLTALGGALLAMWIGRSHANALLLLASVAASSGSVFLIFTASHFPLFALALLLAGAAWNFSLPFQFATISFLDTSGRAGALASSFHAAGLTVGPLIGASVLAIATKDWIIAAASASMFLALVCFIVPAARLRDATDSSGRTIISPH